MHVPKFSSLIIIIMILASLVYLLEGLDDRELDARSMQYWRHLLLPYLQRLLLSGERVDEHEQVLGPACQEGGAHDNENALNGLKKRRTQTASAAL